MGVSRLSKDQVSAIARDFDTDVSEAGGLVLTVAMLWGALHAGVGRGGPGAREPPAGPGPMRKSIRGIRSSKNAPP